MWTRRTVMAFLSPIGIYYGVTTLLILSRVLPSAATPVQLVPRQDAPGHQETLADVANAELGDDITKYCGRCVNFVANAKTGSPPDNFGLSLPQSSIDYILAGIDRGQTANDLCSRVKKSWLTIVIQASLSQWQQWYYLPEEVSNDVSTVVNGLGQGIDCQNGGGSSPSPVNAPGGSGQAVPQNAGTQSSQQPAQGAWGNLPPVKDDYAKDPKRTMAAPQCVQFLTTLGGKTSEDAHQQCINDPLLQHWFSGSPGSVDEISLPGQGSGETSSGSGSSVPDLVPPELAVPPI